MSVRNRYLVFFLSLLWFGSACAGQLWAAGPVSIRGKVSAGQGPLEGAYVGAHARGKTLTNYVMTDSTGQFTFRGLAAGSYTVFIRTPGFRSARKDSVAVQAGREAVADFQVEPETNFLERVELASNSELMESLPGTRKQKEALFYRCDGCHGTYYIAKTRFTRRDWLRIISMMKSSVTTPVGDLAPPIDRGETRDPSVRGEEEYFRAGQQGLLTDDEHLAEYLSTIRGPESPEFPIKFQPRPTGRQTRAVVTEYQLPRQEAWPHDVLLDPRGRYVWYNDWRSNYFGRIDIQSGEIKEYPIPGRDDRPPGFLSLQWDHMGNLWGGQLWSGRAVRFDTRNERFTGSWGVPQEWARTGTVGVCRHAMHPDGPVWIDDALLRKHWTLNPETGRFTEHDTKGSRFACDSKGNIYSLAPGKVIKTEPGTKKMTEFPAPTSGADPHRLTLDGDENVWYGDWEKAKITYLDTKTGKVTEFPALTPWSRVYNAIGDHVRKVGWAVPHVSDKVMKADARTGQVTEFPLPSRGHAVRNVDIEMSANPPAIWFVNQRYGRIVRFQEYVE
jgi:streptogramin lyase